MKRITNLFLEQNGASDQLKAYFNEKYELNGRPADFAFINEMPRKVQEEKSLLLEACKITNFTGILPLPNEEDQSTSEYRFINGEIIKEVLFDKNNNVIRSIDYKEQRRIKKIVKILTLLYPEGVTTEKFYDFVENYEQISNMKGL